MGRLSEAKKIFEGDAVSGRNKKIMHNAENLRYAEKR